MDGIYDPDEVVEDSVCAKPGCTCDGDCGDGCSCAKDTTPVVSIGTCEFDGMICEGIVCHGGCLRDPANVAKPTSDLVSIGENTPDEIDRVVVCTYTDRQGRIVLGGRLQSMDGNTLEYYQHGFIDRHELDGTIHKIRFTGDVFSINAIIQNEADEIIACGKSGSGKACIAVLDCYLEPTRLVIYEEYLIDITTIYRDVDQYIAIAIGENDGIVESVIAKISSPDLTVIEARSFRTSVNDDTSQVSVVCVINSIVTTNDRSIIVGGYINDNQTLSGVIFKIDNGLDVANQQVIRADGAHTVVNHVSVTDDVVSVICTSVKDDANPTSFTINFDTNLNPMANPDVQIDEHQLELQPDPDDEEDRKCKKEREWEAENELEHARHEKFDELER